MFQVNSTTSRRGRPEAAAAIWDWMETPASDTGASGWANPRIRGSIQGVVAITAGALIRSLWLPHLGAVLIALGAVFLATALISPGGLFAGVERALLALGNAVSGAISWLLLAGVFYLFFLPYGRLFKSGRRDPMKRFYEPDAAGYWEAHVRGRSASDSRTKLY